MTVVVGTAGHIDHGKTALLRALTGIDADRLPEERRRGMTIDVGYAHLGLPDGSEIDFVDVPGHDRLVGNMLVGAGEIDAVLLVVAADDGPRAQTLEHLALLDALGLRHGLVAITKIDVVGAERIEEVRHAVVRLLAATGLAGSPIVPVSSTNGTGIDDLKGAIAGLQASVLADASGERSTPARLAIDRVFSVKGRGVVVTGTLRGEGLARNTLLELVPGGQVVRARELQVHNRAVERAGPGRTAINLAGVDAVELHRGMVLTEDSRVVATDRLLVRLAVPLADRAVIRFHLGTAAAEGSIGRSGRDAIDLPGGGATAILRLVEPVAAAPGDRFVLRRGSGTARIVGGVVLDVAPPRGISRRRQTPERVARLAAAIGAPGDMTGSWEPIESREAVAAATLDLHGAKVAADGRVALAADVEASVAAVVLRGLGEGSSSKSDSGEHTLALVRAHAARSLRRVVTLRREQADVAAIALLDRLVAQGRIVRSGQRVDLPGTARTAPATTDARTQGAMDRLERALAVAAPPALGEAARIAGCPPAGVVELESAGRIVVLEPDLAYAASTYRALEAQALELASRAPLTPATLRDATGTSRKYVMAILADLDRRGILRRVDAGHVPGPRAATVGAVTVPR